MRVELEEGGLAEQARREEARLRVAQRIPGGVGVRLRRGDVLRATVDRSELEDVLEENRGELRRLRQPSSGERAERSVRELFRAHERGPVARRLVQEEIRCDRASLVVAPLAPVDGSVAGDVIPVQAVR